jgi:DNA polymerase III alpha subunit
LSATLTKNMTPNQYGEPVYTEQDLCDAALSGKNVAAIENLLVDNTVDLAQLPLVLEQLSAIGTWRTTQNSNATVEEYDRRCQSQWHMPAEYQTLDIAAHVIDLCTTPEQLQRVGEELLLYQERGLFDLLRYLVYLVDTMKQHQIIWGVGRGSSVASYVLYLLEVHRIDSMFYDLDPREFLR